MEIRLHIPDPILRSYFCGRFPAHEDGFRVDTRNLVGLALSTLATRAGGLKELDQTEDDPVTVYLSKSKYNDEHRGKILYLSRAAEAKVNAILRQEFDTTFTSFCTDAKICGFKIKDIIEAFIVEYQLDLFEGDIETLKKRYYRYELSTLKKLREKLRQKAYYAVKRARKIMNSAAL